MNEIENINSLKNSYINFATLCDAFRRYELYNSLEARNIIDLYAKNIDVFPLPAQNMWGNALAVSLYTHHYKSALYMLNKSDELNLNPLFISYEGYIDDELSLGNFKTSKDEFLFSLSYYDEDEDLALLSKISKVNLLEYDSYKQAFLQKKEAIVEIGKILNVSITKNNSYIKKDNKMS